MLSKTIAAAITLVGLAAAAPLSSYDPCPTICQDGVNDCGESWGGCWDICKPEKSPTPPPCTATYTPTIPTITSDPQSPFQLLHLIQLLIFQSSPLTQPSLFRLSLEMGNSPRPFPPHGWKNKCASGPSLLE
ncbi:hypothetical protein NXS19_009296 [Fusarium pseudograminearum]|nr:hypothetical protein NXS19_009296 [Fusarium pseudograminearum]